MDMDDDYEDDDNRDPSSQLKRAHLSSAIAGEELHASSVNPLVGRYGSTQSIRKSSQAKPSQGTDAKENNTNV